MPARPRSTDDARPCSVGNSSEIAQLLQVLAGPNRFFGGSRERRVMSVDRSGLDEAGVDQCEANRVNPVLMIDENANAWSNMSSTVFGSVILAGDHNVRDAPLPRSEGSFRTPMR